MNEEKKEYSVVGTVTIGTDEYRDLIEGINELNYENEKLDNEKSKEYWARYQAEKDLAGLNKKYEELLAFCKTKETFDTEFKLWKLEQMKGEEE